MNFFSTLPPEIVCSLASNLEIISKLRVLDRYHRNLMDSWFFIKDWHERGKKNEAILALYKKILNPQHPLTVLAGGQQKMLVMPEYARAPFFKRVDLENGRISVIMVGPEDKRYIFENQKEEVRNSSPTRRICTLNPERDWNIKVDVIDVWKAGELKRNRIVWFRQPLCINDISNPDIFNFFWNSLKYSKEASQWSLAQPPLERE